MAFFSRTFIATAVAAALALPVLAQQTPADAAATAQTQVQAQTPAQISAPMNAERRAKHMEQRRVKMQDRMAQHQAQLKQKLELSAAQEPAWNTFIASLKMGECHLERAEVQKMTTPERIERMRAQRAQHHAEADKRADAILAFYAALNPAQQMTFDAQTARYQHHMGSQSGHKKGHSKGHQNW